MKAGTRRFIGFTGHYDPEVHAALLRAYDRWDTVMMPVHAANHAYLSFEQTELPVAIVVREVLAEEAKPVT